VAFSQSQPTVSMIAETTFSSGDLYKFVRVTSSVGRVGVTGSSDATFVIGTLLSETYTTSTGANEAVTVGLLSGIGKVAIGGSTLMVGAPISASSLGYGVAVSTGQDQIGIVIEAGTAFGSSGTAGAPGGSSSTGRIGSVLFVNSYIASS
jgi:hypothetical protein